MNAHPEFRDNPFLAVPSLSGLLKKGRLALFLGAGVAKGFGLPDWVTLMLRILGKDNDPAFVKRFRKLGSSEQIKALDEIDDHTDEYLVKVHEALYRQISQDLVVQLTKSPLLLAIAALLTGSCRGRIQTVFSYNYDDLVEQYLQSLGYSVQRRFGAADLGSWADVELNYVHGYLPQSWIGSRGPVDLILSDHSYRGRRARIDKGWSAYVQHVLHSRIGLFLGLSGEDGSLLDILERAHSEIINCVRQCDYSGYWLLTPDAYERNASTLIKLGMCPIPIEKETIPKFIFAVCENAVRK